MHVTIVGGGIIGLSTAYWLNKEGIPVTIIESGDGTVGCSFGNAGYISPSHFIPLASPGIVAQGLKYMLSSTSPFYIQPRLNGDLIRWAYHFYKKSTTNTVAQNAPELHNILGYSKEMTIEMAKQIEHKFDLCLDGCTMMYRLEKTAHHEEEMAKMAHGYGLKTITMDKSELQKFEPDVEINAYGGIWYADDAHVNPNKLMQELQAHLLKNGVEIIYNTSVVSFEKKGRMVNGLSTNRGAQMKVDHIVMATGAWLPSLSKDLGINLLLQAGKGYSYTFENVTNKLKHPAILVDDRVALTPLGNNLRTGGTMELSGINHRIRRPRIDAVVKASNDTFTNLNLEIKDENKIWCGLRPVTPDGLPYIGKTSLYDNLVLAGGHAMLGISLSAGTGALVSQLLVQDKTAIKMDAFRPERF